MRNQLSELVAALRAPVDVDRAARLRTACDRMFSVGVPAERVGPLQTWRKKLERFEKLDDDQQAVEIMRGLRMCAAMGGDIHAPAPVVAAPVPRVIPVGPLQQSLRSVGGIGPKFAACLAEAGLETLEDLVWFVPRRYDDLRHVKPLALALAGVEPGARVTLSATVSRIRGSQGRWRKRWAELLLTDRDGDSGNQVQLAARWFNVHGGIGKRFPVGSQIVVSGPLKFRDGIAELNNPDVLGDPENEGTAHRAKVRPRYKEIEGVAAAIVRRACRVAVERAADHVVDGVPAAVRARMALPTLGEALASLHNPPASVDDELANALARQDSVWHRRLAFDELFFLALAVAQRRGARRVHQAPPCVAPPGAMDRVAAALPFVLTGAQRRAIDAIVADMERTEPMNRLLQGDVGSGKTAVAFAAAHAAIAAGRQVAIMAPTELLSEQHLASLTPWANALGHRVALLTASTPRGVRESLLGMLAAGAIDIIVGTHSLLSEAVGFNDLGLVVIDEQHRFGVAQRVKLRVKGGGQPHLLVMTATPIPRTLALTVYGDLDVTTLDELPPGRTPAKTKVVGGPRGREQAYKLLKRECALGARAFVVCPLIEPSEDSEARERASAVQVADELAELLAPLRVGLVHGRIPSVERDDQMARLRRGDLDVLVATTVIEVGVDVPVARVMIVEDADSFGLAQLHQLRGRVGRGAGQSYCLLLTRGTKTAEAQQRLAVMEETCDGFRIAEEDMAIRGPGEILGVKQAGLPRLRFGDLVKHAALAGEARREAERVLADDATLSRDEHAVTARVLGERLRAAMVVGDGG